MFLMSYIGKRERWISSHSWRSWIHTVLESTSRYQRCCSCRALKQGHGAVQGEYLWWVLQSVSILVSPNSLFHRRFLQSSQGHSMDRGHVWFFGSRPSYSTWGWSIHISSWVDHRFYRDIRHCNWAFLWFALLHCLVMSSTRSCPSCLNIAWCSLTTCHFQNNRGALHYAIWGPRAEQFSSLSDQRISCNIFFLKMTDYYILGVQYSGQKYWCRYIYMSYMYITYLNAEGSKWNEARNMSTRVLYSPNLSKVSALLLSEHYIHSHTSKDS